MLQQLLQRFDKTLILTTVLLCFFMAGIRAVYGENLPDIGNSAGTLLSPEEEKHLGWQFMRSVRRSLKLVEDPAANEYIQSLGLRLASQVSTGEQTFQFFIVNDQTVNAFAGPAGYIGIHSGLILASNTEGELASVMAHEIAHVTQKHLIRSAESSQTMSLSTMAAIFAGILLGQGNPKIGQAVIASTLAGSTQQQLSFSRLHEQEADRVGIEMLVNAGYDANNMANFFEVLDQKNRFSNANIPEFILTHPVTASRIADTRGRAAQFQGIQRGASAGTYYELIRARVKTLTNNNKRRTTQTQSIGTQLAPPTTTLTKAERYALALQSMTEGNYTQAKQYLQQLMESDRKRILYYVALGEIEMLLNKPEQAIKLLDQSLQIYPNNRVLITLYAKALIKAGRAKTATRILQYQLRQPSAPPAMYKLYAIAAKDIGRLGQAYESLAEYYLLTGETMTAIRHLEKSLRQADTSHNDTIRVKAKLNELKNQVVKKQPVNTHD